MAQEQKENKRRHAGSAWHLSPTRRGAGRRVRAGRTPEARCTVRPLSAVPALLALWLPSHALAWGDEGHRIVCELAFREVADATRDRIKALVATDRAFTRFSDSCTWPDHPRQRAEEHYVDLVRYAAGLRGDACPLADRCAIGAVELDAARLLLPEAAPGAHLAALKSLGHWVGDVHQPLHVSFDDDRGANEVKVTGLCTGNLHAAWDTCLVERAVGTDPMAAADQLEAAITDAERDAWAATGPVQWANESFAIATAPATGYCVQSGGVCTYEAGNVALDPGEPEKTVTVDAAYLAAAAPVVRDRLKRAGVRLAHLLDRALGN